MSERTREIQKQVIQEREKLRRDPAVWKGFLKNMTYRSKISFEQQMMIYFQNPESTAVASYDTWNNRLNRFVMRRSTGIAVFPLNNPNNAVYLFDVSSTTQNRKMPEVPLDLFLPRESDAADIRNEFRNYLNTSISDDTAVEDILFNAVSLRTEAYLNRNYDRMIAGNGAALTPEQHEERKARVQRFITASSLYALQSRTRDASFADGYTAGLFDLPKPDEDLFDNYEEMYAAGNAVQYVVAEVMDRLSAVYKRNVRAERQARIDTLKKQLEEAREKAADLQEVATASTNPALAEEKRREEAVFSRSTENVSESDTFSSTEASASEVPSSDVIDEAESVQTISGVATRSGYVSFEDALAEPGVAPTASMQPEPTEAHATEEHRDQVRAEEPAVSAGHREPTGAMGPQDRTGEDAETENREVYAPVVSHADERVDASVKNIPTEVFHGVLRMGSNRENSLPRLSFMFTCDVSPEKLTDAVKKEYGHGGMGIRTHDGLEYAVWFNEDGMRIAKGHSVNAAIDEKATYNWDEVRDGIQELLYAGSYTSQLDLDRAESVFLKEFSEDLWHMERELDNEVSAALFDQKGTDEDLFPGEFLGFPEHTKRIRSLLASDTRRKDLYSRLESFNVLYQADPDRFMRMHWHKPQALLDKLSWLISNRGFYVAQEDYTPTSSVAFITDDEIAGYLRRGSGFSEGKMRIYAHFVSHNKAAERAEFLKNEYGTGGHSHALNSDRAWADYDAKGLVLRRDNTVAVFREYWTKVERRVSELIAQDQFLSEKEKEQLADYERKEIARSVVRFYGRAAGEKPYIGNPIADYDKCIMDVLDNHMSNRETFSLLVAKMEQDLIATDPDETRDYDSVIENFREVRGYYDGTFSIYNPVSEPNQIESETPQSVSEKPEKKDNSGQMSLFDMVPDPEPETVVAPPEENVSESDTISGDTISGDDYAFARVEQPKSPFDNLAVGDTLVDGNGILWRVDRVDWALNISVYDANTAETNGLYERSLWNWRQRVAETGKLDEKEDFQLISREEYEARYATGRVTAEENDEQDKIVSESDTFSTTPADTADNAAAETTSNSDDEVKLNSIVVDLRPRDPQEQPSLSADDVTNLRYVSSKITNYGHTVEYDLEADIRGERTTIHYTVSRHDGDDESFDIHTDENDIWDLMPERELRKLEPILSDEVAIGQYLEDINSAIDLESLKEIEYSFMDDESFPRRLNSRFWDAYRDREQMFLSELENMPAGTEDEDFYITDDDLGVGPAKEKYWKNTSAIVLLKELEAEGRPATLEEKHLVLSKYVGWGGLPDIFDENKPGWKTEYDQLKKLLTEEEYEAARASTLNAHYTSPVVIRAMYDVIVRMGFRSGNILEPACGVGNFFGMLPSSMRESRLYATELDSISGRIAQKIYPEANIRVAGYETAKERGFFDLAVGNVPFGNYKVNDPDYNHLKFTIHNYFFAKALDQVRVGGIVAFVTSRYTMDQKDETVRKYIADRADLLGAIRLPKTAFLENAGASVVTDILFLQKRDVPVSSYPEWVELAADDNGITYNRYFVEHPEMVLGTVATESTQYGQDALTVLPYEGRSLEDLLNEAGRRIHGQYMPQEIAPGESAADIEDAIPATPDYKNFAYAEIDGKVYYRQDTVMLPYKGSSADEARVRSLVGVRDALNDVIYYQQENYPQEEIEEKQTILNDVYDAFVDKYGRISTNKNERAFRDDSSYFLLSSLEILDNRGEFERKADIFTTRTIQPAQPIDHVDTPAEALAVSIGERAEVDLTYMAELLGGEEKIPEIVEKLQGVIFKRPESGSFDPENLGEVSLRGWQTADEYLSGNVREKLRVAQEAAEADPRFAMNVSALERVQPEELDASEIDARLGATWIPVQYIQDFMNELFEVPYYMRPMDSYYYSDRNAIRINYASVTSEWSISNKSRYGGVLVNRTYGTERVNAFYILESTLNLKDVRVFDTERDSEGKERRILNRKETMLAQQKQQAIKTAFGDWIWKDPERRRDLVALYNERFNSRRTREYDGSHITFAGINPNIELREHQRAAIARILYGGNTLLAHEVGAGKTFEMIASAMESKRLGLSRKPMFVVPNHLTLQWAVEFLRLYPGANLLVATKADFEMKNRKRFCAKIATGNYDGVIIGHSQFKMIGLSPERQERMLREQIQELVETIAATKHIAGERFSIKQMEKTKKSLEANLEKLANAARKDDVITFEQLGVDRLYVDESQAYKNLAIFTKMRNVPGISSSGSAMATDMFMKCRYMDEITGGKGVIFATGTPISNSMTEMYSLMRYLQHDTLQELGLNSFDSWAATFGESVTAVELAPEGTGYRARTRFARFFNLPELMTLFKEAADIKTAEVLNIPGLPDVVYESVAVEASGDQKMMIDGLSKRAKAIHDGNVSPNVDNMLKITSDGRKIGLDQRLMNAMLPDEPDSKVNTCIEKIFEIWESTSEERSTQLVFCDQSVPKEKVLEDPLASFNIYDDIKEKLIARGVPADEIAYIHSARDDKEKKKMFDKVNAGEIRVLIGSTQKMGAGTNVQTRLIALHHLDAPWRPSDMTQRNGRIIRQNNMNSEVKIFTYVTQGTFDAYLYQMLENKQKFIGQIMTSRTPVRYCEDIDEQALSYAEVKALCAGNPLIKERMELDVEVQKLRIVKSDFMSSRYRLEDDIATRYPEKIAILKERVAGLTEDIRYLNEVKPKSSEEFMMTIKNKTYDKSTDAGEALLDACRGLPPMQNHRQTVGEYLGFNIAVGFEPFSAKFFAYVKRTTTLEVVLGTDGFGNVTRIMNALNGMEKKLEEAKDRLKDAEKQLAIAKEEVAKPFAQAEELAAKEARLAELDAALNIDGGVDNNVAAIDMEETANDDLQDEPAEEESADVSDSYVTESAQPSYGV